MNDVVLMHLIDRLGWITIPAAIVMIVTILCIHDRWNGVIDKIIAGTGSTRETDW